MLNSTKHFAALFFLFATIFVSVNCAAAKMPVATFSSSKDSVNLEVAQTTEEIQRGLMYRTSLPEDSGMVFLFHPNHTTRFWMYHTLIPLDMLFIKDGKILKICESVPPCRSQDPHDCALYPEEGDITVSEVLELNGGYCKRHGIKQGDSISFAL
jgi:uncharacterized protein